MKFFLLKEIIFERRERELTIKKNPTFFKNQVTVLLTNIKCTIYDK